MVPFKYSGCGGRGQILAGTVRHASAPSYLSHLVRQPTPAPGIAAALIIAAGPAISSGTGFFSITQLLSSAPNLVPNGHSIEHYQASTSIF
jgi:hypothetical protein